MTKSLQDRFDILQFLAEYETFPCLWDRDHVFFKNRKERSICEQILGDKLGIRDLSTLKRKIRSVRGTYNAEIKKIKYCLENGFEVYPPKLSWFAAADTFLRVTTDLPYQLFPPPTTDLAEPSKIILLKKLPQTKRSDLFLVSVTNEQIKEGNQEDCTVTVQVDKQINDEETMEDYKDYEELESFDELENSDHKTDENSDHKTDENSDHKNDENSDHKSVKESVRSVSDKIDTVEVLHPKENDNTSVSSRSKLKTNSIQNQNLRNIESVSSGFKLKTNSIENQNLSAVVNYLKDIVTENEFIAFGRSVGVQLKNMPLKLAVQLQMDIQAHITKTRLEHLQKTQKRQRNKSESE